MGSTQFKTPRANWDKRCCSNSRGPVVEIPDDVSEEDANKINKQIARMPNLKQVCTNVTQVMWVCTDVKKICKEKGGIFSQALQKDLNEMKLFTLIAPYKRIRHIQ